MTIEQDQARRLRELVRENSRLNAPKTRAPVTVVVAGGCPQVGATTIAQRLAAELERQATHVELRASTTAARDRCATPDIVLLDAGAGYTDQSTARWRDADLVLLVTTADRDAVLETYATLKFARANLSHLPIHLVVNQCTNFDVARDVGNRISESSKRFLGMAVPMAGWIPAFEVETLSSDASFAELARFLLGCAETAHVLGVCETAA